MDDQQRSTEWPDNRTSTLAADPVLDPAVQLLLDDWSQPSPAQRTLPPPLPPPPPHLPFLPNGINHRRLLRSHWENKIIGTNTADKAIL